MPAKERLRRREELAKSYRERIDKHESFYPYVSYPYIEWYSEANGRVVLELDPEQLEIISGKASGREKTAEERVADKRRREQSLVGFLRRIALGLLPESRRQKAAKPEKAIE